MSLKRTEQGGRERAHALEQQLEAAQRAAEAAGEAARRAQQESSAAVEALRGEAISAREQTEDLRDENEALESQLQEKVGSANHLPHCVTIFSHSTCASQHGGAAVPVRSCLVSIPGLRVGVMRRPSLSLSWSRGSRPGSNGLRRARYSWCSCRRGFNRQRPSTRKSCKRLVRLLCVCRLQEDCL